MQDSNVDVVGVEPLMLKLITCLLENIELNKQVVSNFLVFMKQQPSESKPPSNNRSSNEHLSDLSVSSFSDLGGTDSEDKGQSIKSGKKHSLTSAYQNNLKENNAMWRKSKNSDLGNFLDSSEIFTSLCAKKFPELNTMRELLTDELDNLDEDDFDGFNELVLSFKEGGDSPTRRRQWLSFLRVLCNPYFNKQEPETTGVIIFYYYIFILVSAIYYRSHSSGL